MDADRVRVRPRTGTEEPAFPYSSPPKVQNQEGLKKQFEPPTILDLFKLTGKMPPETHGISPQTVHAPHILAHYIMTTGHDKSHPRKVSAAESCDVKPKN